MSRSDGATTNPLRDCLWMYMYMDMYIYIYIYIHIWVCEECVSNQIQSSWLIIYRSNTWKRSALHDIEIVNNKVMHFISHSFQAHLIWWWAKLYICMEYILIHMEYILSVRIEEECKWAFELQIVSICEHKR